mmetsp:Transcript_26958/g.41338  ORF Transcript_26958/g.41338 Transcript_26958/m.41338 type:complete len:488 (+) Transcript_26958:57-1520(+)
MLFRSPAVVSLLRVVVTTSFGALSRSSTATTATATTLAASHQTARCKSTTTAAAAMGKKIFTLQKVCIVHRHGDRTPITPMVDEAFWASTLPNQSILEKMAEGTRLVRDDSNGSSTTFQHAASGIGPFGKLTQLGMMQMVELGQRLREQLVVEDDKDEDDEHCLNEQDEDGYYNNHALFSSSSTTTTTTRRLTPDNIKVTCTDFTRTILSVRALLVGLFPNNNSSNSNSSCVIDIDLRHTNIMIPDPEPRSTKEQEILEVASAQKPHVLEKEANMKHLAIRTTFALRDILSKDANKIRFGVKEGGSSTTTTSSDNNATAATATAPEVLPWAQLAEITKCLHVRNRLPPTISIQDQRDIAAHAAWRWFQTLSEPRIAYLAMAGFVKKILTDMMETHTDVPLHVYSGHDSTLIGLLSVLRLEQPSTWPEYCSYLKIQVYKEQEEGKLYLRFSLNGELLRTYWGVEGNDGDDGEPIRMLPMEELRKGLDL